MPLTLHVDTQRWRTHLTSMLEKHPGLVPVIKGNGYGFGLANLALEAKHLGITSIAVGTSNEVSQVRTVFDGEIMVLSPDGEQILGTIITISDINSLKKLNSDQEFVLEILTPMKRHGISIIHVGEALNIISERHLKFRGFSLHLPIALIEKGWIRSTLSAIPADSTVWISHLYKPERMRKAFPNMTFHERIGTSLWLGEPDSLNVSATVLENHHEPKSAGYRQRQVSGNVIVVSGGTANGIGLSAPTSDLSLAGRMKSIGRGIESAFGKFRSPYRWKGKFLNFLEPPHMQCSMLIYKGNQPPQKGEELAVRVRHTTTNFDGINFR